MALWSVFICAGLSMIHIKDKQLFVRAVLYSAVSLIYFIVVIKFVMPALGNHPERGYQHFKYSALGKDFAEAMRMIFSHPLHSLKLFFINHLNDPAADEIKRELFLTLLFSGGFLLLLNPKFLVMLIPIFAQKLLSDDFGKWGLNGQYCIEFAPILTLCSFTFINQLKSRNLSLIFPAVLCMSTGLTTFYKLECKISPSNPVNEQFYSTNHYACEFDRKKLWRP